MTGTVEAARVRKAARGSISSPAAGTCTTAATSASTSAWAVSAVVRLRSRTAMSLAPSLFGTGVPGSIRRTVPTTPARSWE